MSPLLVGVVWGLLGLATGTAVRLANVWLAKKEQLEPGRRRWQVLGPPLVAGLLFGLFGWKLGPTPLLLLRSLWVGVLVQVIFFDFEHHLILDRVMLPGALAALGLSLVTPHLGWLSALLTGLGTGAAFLLVALLGSVVFRAEAMGLGDVKFSVFLGLILGFPWILYAVLAGVLAAGVVAVTLVLLRLRSMTDSIAYGPYLAAGALLALFNLPGG